MLKTFEIWGKILMKSFIYWMHISRQTVNFRNNYLTNSQRTELYLFLINIIWWSLIATDTILMANIHWKLALFLALLLALLSLVKKGKGLCPKHRLKVAESKFEPRRSDPREHTIERTWHGNRLLRFLLILRFYISMKRKWLYFSQISP